MSNYLLLKLPHDFWYNLIKAVSIAMWVVGTFMIVLPLCNWLLKRFRGRARFRTLSGSEKKSGGLSFKQIPWVRELSEEMEIAEMKVSVEFLLSLSVLLGILGYFGASGMIYILQQEFATGLDREASTNSWLLGICVSLLFITLPYFFVRFRVQRKRHRIAIRMIMLVQNLIGHYRKNTTIAEVILKSGASMPEDVVSEWKQLEISLHMMSLEDALLRFAKRIDNIWADDLIDLLSIGANYGTDISGAMHKLVQDMQTAKRNEEKRLAMVSMYRIGTTFMVFFAFFIVGFNIYADGANFRHYFVDPQGKAALLIASIVMFLAMVLVVRTGKKQF